MGDGDRLTESKRSRLVELSLKVDTDIHSDEYVAEMKELCESLGDEIDFRVEPEHLDMHQLGKAAKYLARLYLLGNGDRRSSVILENVELDGTMVTHAETVIPWPIASMLPPHALIDGENLHDLLPFEQDGDDGRRLIIICSNSKHGDAGLSADESYRIGASVVCCELFNLIKDSYPTFLVDVGGEVGTFEVVRVNPFMHCVIDEIAKGNVAACANCGRPIYVGRSNASPFCNRGHYNRYREKAKRMVKRGCSLDEVRDAYPEIPVATVESWIVDLAKRRG